MLLNQMRSFRNLLWAVCLSSLAVSALANDNSNDKLAEPGFVPTKLRSDYLKMPVAELTPMLDWLEDVDLHSNEIDPAKDDVVSPGIRALMIHSKLLRGQHAEALSMIAAARAAEDKPLQRPMLYIIEDILAQASAEESSEPRFAAMAAQKIAALPWPAARTHLKQLLHTLDIEPFEKTLSFAAAYTDNAYKYTPPLNEPNAFASDIVERRYFGQTLGCHALSLRKIIQSLLDAKAGEPSFWQQRAYPALPRHGQQVRVAVWEPEGVDIALFKHPKRACLSLEDGSDCLIDPKIDGISRSHAWALVQGYEDDLAGKATSKSKAWQAFEFRLMRKSMNNDSQLLLTLPQMIMAKNRQHGTHVAGIVVNGNPFVELVAIRDAKILDSMTNFDESQWVAHFDRIVYFLKQNQVRVVNMSWSAGIDQSSQEHAGAFEKHMLTLMGALPNTLFVAAAGNENLSVNKYRSLPASLSAANLLTVGAVDKDGQVTDFSNIGPSVALYGNGDSVLSVGPSGYPLVMSGTSMAAPQVCNVAAKLLSQHPELTVAELKRLLIDGADELPAGDQIATSIKILNPARSAALGGRPLVRIP